MASKTSSHTANTSKYSYGDFDDSELRSTMRSFLEEKKEEQPSVWNFATIAGIAMFLVCMFYIFQLIGLIGADLTGLVHALPFIGVILIGFIGFGFFVGDRKRLKKIQKKRQQQRDDYFEQEFPSGQADDNVDLEKELFGDSSRPRSASGAENSMYDNYALHQSKKLYKSRTDKKIAGVCGGLARYFGISSKVLRILFVITFFASSGTAMIAYIALALALDKEPKPDIPYNF